MIEGLLSVLCAGGLAKASSSSALTSPICRLHASAPLRSARRRRAPRSAPHDLLQITAYRRTYSRVLTGTRLASKPASESLRRLWPRKSTARAEESPVGVSQESERAKKRLGRRSCDNGPRERIARESWENEESPEVFLLEAFVNRFTHLRDTCSDCRTRTYDPAVNSRLLYQLS